MWDTEIGDCEGIRIEFTVLKIVEVLLCDARVRVEEDQKDPRPVLRGPRGAWGEPGNDEVPSVPCWLKHLFQGLGMIEETWDVFEHCKGDLEKDREPD